MTSTTAPPKRSFTEAARSKALAARQAKALIPKGDGVEAFVVRASPGSYAWEIRLFGGVVVEYGDDAFPTLAEALAAGRQALARRMGGRWDASVTARHRPRPCKAEPTGKPTLGDRLPRR